MLACVFFIYRMSTLFRAEPVAAAPPGVCVLRLFGALFFGAVSKVEAMPGRCRKARARSCSRCTG